MITVDRTDTLKQVNNVYTKYEIQNALDIVSDLEDISLSVKHLKDNLEFLMFIKNTLDKEEII